MEIVLENVTSFISIVMLIVFSVVGTMQGFKNFLKNKSVPVWLLTIVQWVMCFLFAFLLTENGIKYFIATAILSASVSQLFYELIFQAIEKLIKKVVGATTEGKNEWSVCKN